MKQPSKLFIKQLSVLFVASGNKMNGISPIVRNQGIFLREQGISVTFFTIDGKGLKNYLKARKQLKRFLAKNTIDLVHAHYSFSGFIAGLASNHPIIVSLMGSDVYRSGLFRILIRLFAKFRWNKVIVKSEKMRRLIKLKNAEVIPNGVDLSFFQPIRMSKAQDKLSWNRNDINILFTADPDRSEKNFSLLVKSVELIKKDNIRIRLLKGVPYSMTPYYYNAADVIVLTSLYEGSPNVIKEALACNRPVVSTDAGDVGSIISGIEGCFLCSYKPKDIAEKIVSAIQYQSTKSREQIKNLSKEEVSKKIISVYTSIISNPAHC